jgi:hypothetical protein
MFQNAQHTDAHGAVINDVGRDQFNADNVYITYNNNAGAMQYQSYPVPN